ncbi:MAG: SDR family oxidoreductase [Candidatus Omnitrophota bacterium]
MKALVTGGAGFIGSHLVELLLAQGMRVCAIDNLATGRLHNLSQARRNKKFSFIKVDVSGGRSIGKYFRGVDFVFHLAALADIVPSVVDPLTYHTANVNGTIAVLEASRQARVKKFLYAASSSCYGLATLLPTPEDAPIAPQYPYALTKWLGEEYVRHWAHVYKMPFVSLRLFNVYGPRSRTSGAYGAVFGVFLAQKLHGKPFTVVGDGTQKRDFIYVSDVAGAFYSAAVAKITNTIFNVGSSAPQSINTLVRLLQGPFVHIPKRPGEPDCTWADTSRIKKELGWQAQVSFSEGVRRMLAHIDYWKTAPVWTPQRIARATGDWFKYL